MWHIKKMKNIWRHDFSIYCTRTFVRLCVTSPLNHTVLTRDKCQNLNDITLNMGVISGGWVSSFSSPMEYFRKLNTFAYAFVWFCLLLTFVTALGSALCFNNKLIINVCPCCAAWCRGVYPMFVLFSTAASFSSKYLTMFIWPKCAAKIGKQKRIERPYQCFYLVWRPTNMQWSKSSLCSRINLGSIFE